MVALNWMLLPAWTPWLPPVAHLRWHNTSYTVLKSMRNGAKRRGDRSALTWRLKEGNEDWSCARDEGLVELVGVRRQWVCGIWNRWRWIVEASCSTCGPEATVSVKNNDVEAHNDESMACSSEFIWDGFRMILMSMGFHLMRWTKQRRLESREKLAGTTYRRRTVDGSLVFSGNVRIGRGKWRQKGVAYFIGEVSGGVPLGGGK